MTVLPVRNNAQHQPLTTVLRNIIIDYPAGGGVLRELCQNADDAGATRVEFVLDTKCYETENILNSGLAGYQGPALLAFNDSTFSETDFESLSRIGDSAKVKDLSATGKFGRGFNSVYNWTDMPSILSGESLLILDPHITWSRDVLPGGPVYDFVQASNEPEMHNQLAAFGSILTDFKNRFEGTIIRLPLRTEAQAVDSMIVPDKSTSETDILDAFKKSCNELVESLLFLKNVRTITLRINENIYAKAVSTSYAKDTVNESYKEVFVDQEKELCEIDFLTDISLYRGEETDGYRTGKEEKFRYAISHYLGQGPEDDDLHAWARSQKLFPWIAIAAPLEGSTNFTGRLFNTLPLPIHTKHPVHIHGMFSITPDRSNIHSGEDWTMNERSEIMLGARWNRWLFQKCVPYTWTRNLEFLNRMSESGEARFTGWDFWPAGDQGGGGVIWMKVLGTLFQRVVEQNLKLLPTVRGNTGARDDVLFTLGIQEIYKNALQHAGCPISAPPEDRIFELDRLGVGALGLALLTPATARGSLSKLRNSLGDLPVEFRMVLLEYVVSDKDYEDIGLCQAPLLPTPDGEFHDFSNANGSILYFPRTKEEAEIFKESARMVDTKKLNRETKKQMESDIKEFDRFTAVSIWRVPDAASYCKKYVFGDVKSKSQDMIVRPGFNDFVNQFWEWINIPENIGMLSAQPRLLDGLWLVPTTGDLYHKISDGKSPILDISGPGLTDSFFRGAASRLFDRCDMRYSLYTEEGFTTTTTNILHTCRYIQHCENFSTLIEWLANNSTGFVDMLDDDDKTALLYCLGILSISFPKSSKDNAQKVRKLRLFREVDSTAAPNRPWISLDSVRDHSPVRYVGNKDVPAILSAPDTIFIDISDNDTERLAKALVLVDFLPLKDILDLYVIPGIEGTKDNVLRALVEFSFMHFNILSEESRTKLASAKIVPVSITDPIFIRPVDTVSTVLAPFFFPGENRTPIPIFYRSHSLILAELGMVDKVSETFALERIEAYSQLGRSPKEVGNKAKRLIQHFKSVTKLPEKYLTSRWLPARFRGEVDELYSAEECRDQSFNLLAKYSMPLMAFQVPDSWREALGWNEPLPKAQILKQLDGAVEVKDTEVLRHLILKEGESLMGDYISELQEREWIPDTLGARCYRPADIFLGDFSCFSPYLSTVIQDLKALSCKDFLVKLGVKEEPSFRQLKELQDNLAAKEFLEEADLEVALCVVKEVGKRFAGEDLTDFKAPDNFGSLRFLKYLTAGDPNPDELEYFTANDPDPEKAKRAILHTGVSQDTIKQLHLPSFHHRLLELLSDPNFDEGFTQKESSKTVIEDTLRRYRPSSTFNEYLANAEDCRTATKVSWVLDHSEYYDGTELLVEELKEAQGPALFCCNDGQFTDKDFKAVIDIGVGSKGHDSSKIGKFGRGALTMYHWTSVPSFISGDSFVIFDPLLKYNLPVHPATRKPRAGMKLKLRDVRRKYPDQLRPFEGIFGFNKDTASFPGTIFRFPLSTRSGLIGGGTDSEKTPGQYLRDHFKSAMDSLLFLEKITSISFQEINIPSSSPSALIYGLVEEEPSDDFIWKVSSERLEVSEDPKIKELTVRGQSKILGELEYTSDKWCIISGGSDRGGLEKSLVKIQMKERLQARYSLAASISKLADFRGRNYMSLPLIRPSTLDIPVHVDANLVVQSDRRSIPLADSENEEGSEWNRWVFEKGVAPLYLELVEYLMKTGVGGYRYWPPDPSSTTDTISQVISAAFWEKVVELFPYELFPPETLHKNETLRNLEFEAATFDLLDPAGSEFFVTLLLQLGLRNIVSPPQRIRDYLKAYKLAPMKMVSPEYLLDLLRSPTYRNKLLQIWKEEYQYDIQFFNTLLSFIVNETTQENLIGIQLLPLADNSLGQFLSKTSATAKLIARTPEERAILDISPNLAVHPDLEPSVVEKFLSMGELNIANFQFEDIPKLHKTPGEKSIDYRKAWAKNVWSYFEKCVHESPEKQETYLSILNDIPVYFGTPVGSDTQTVFLSPADLSAGSIPAIVEQSGLTDSQSSILKLFNGLVLLDPSAFPQTQLSSEIMGNASGVLGIYRLLRSIKNLAGELSIEKYITETLQVDKLEALRKLLDPTVMEKLRKAYPKSTEYLKRLPIWPSEAEQLLSYKPATEAILAPNYSISFTGLTENDLFIRASIAHAYSDELSSLGVRKMSLDELLRDYVHSGQKIEDSRIPSYGSFLDSLYRWNPGAFSQHPLAVDGNGEHCMLDSLYDTGNNIFLAAFRGMKACFLHPGLRDLPIWRDTGLRRETARYYLDCVSSIEQRRRASPIEDEQLIADAQTIFEYLSWDKQGMQSWSSNTWNMLYTNSAAPAQTRFGNNPEYRKPQMRTVLQNSNFTALSTAVVPEHADIAWSQCPILKNKLGSFVTDRIPNNGLPSTEIVLKHLIYLSENHGTVAQQEISAYVSDVKACYEYLQNKISDLPSPDTKAMIWLNVEAADIILMSEGIFRDSWKCSELLCSGLKSDSQQIKYVRSFLIPFANLLDHYQVEKYFPSEEIKPPSPSTEYPAVILSGFQRYRQGGAFLDITLDVGGTEVQAHRIVLASASRYWRTMLTGNFQEANERKIKLDELKPRTVTAVLEYIYTGEVLNIDKSADPSDILQDLIYQLEVSDLWELDGLKAKLEYQISRKDLRLIRPETVRSILQHAKEANAASLIRICEDYKLKNMGVVNREDPQD